MSSRKSTKKERSAQTRTRAGLASSAASGKADIPDNGMHVFAMHSLDEDDAPAFARLRDERSASLAFTAAPVDTSNLDPETAATRYLHQALASKAVPSLTAPKSEGVDSEFKTLGTDTIPLTETKMVKFRQTYNKIPVYGSLVSVELDDKNNLVSLNSSIGEPKGVSPIAKISPADALGIVAKATGKPKLPSGLVPHLFYYFDQNRSKWRLALIVEDVPVFSKADPESKDEQPPLYKDFVVDAHTGALVAELPRTSSLAYVEESAVDGKKDNRKIGIETNGKEKTMYDSHWNVRTFDFRFADPIDQSDQLPGKTVTNPPAPWSPSAVSAHANATAVARFLRDVLKRNNIDDHGGPMSSSINCVAKRYSQDGRQWFNAFWNGKQMVYGQRLDGKSYLSLSVDLDVVGHEMFHGITEFTARLEYVSQSGALNESYSDIFGVIIANLGVTSDVKKWDWEIGEGLSANGKPFRNMQNPPLYKQPDHMKDYQHLPETEDGDYGGVHTNSGIHNKVAYNMLTAQDAGRNPVLAPEEVGAIFYLTLTQQLSRTSQFSDSRRGALISARSLFRQLPAAEQRAKLSAIEAAFDSVSIS